MEKQIVPFSERIKLIRYVRRSLKREKGYKAFIIAQNENTTKAFIYGKTCDICQMIDDTIDKSEEVSMIIKIVSLKKAHVKMAGDAMPEFLKKIMEEKSKEEPSETPEPDKVNTEENPQQNEHAE